MSSNEIKTNGFVVMDTNCFLKYISEQKKENARFDYDGVRMFIDEQNFMLVITPYTLYECIQGCNTIDTVQQRSREMTSLWDFWVLNINEIIGNKYTLEAGPDFTFSLKMNPGTLEEFVEKRRELRRKVYESLLPRIILLSQLIAVVYLLITEQRDDGLYEVSMKRRIEYALSAYFREAQNFKVQFFSFIESSNRIGMTIEDGMLVKTKADAKDSLSCLIHSYAIQIMKVTKVIMDGEKMGVKFNWGEYNDRIFAEMMNPDGYYTEKEMRSKYKAYVKRQKNRVKIEKYVDNVMQGYETIFKHLYKKVLSDWFEHQGSGKQLMNTIIDYVNTCTIESLKSFPVIYMTEEKKFVELIERLSDNKVRLTQQFYRRYYK